MNDNIMKNGLLFVYHFEEDILTISHLFSKQKTTKLICKNLFCLNFLNDKNLDEIGAKAEFYINKDLKVNLMTFCSFHSEKLISYSHKINYINEKKIPFEKIIKISFHSDSIDNSTILIIEFENIKSIKNELYNFYEKLCSMIKEYNKKNYKSEIIIESNMINRPINTIKKNIHIILNIFSFLMFNQKINKKININDIINNHLNNFLISDFQVYENEIEIFLENQNLNFQIKLSIISLSEVSCFIQIMEKIKFIQYGKIISQISKINQNMLKLVKEYFEHFISL